MRKYFLALILIMLPLSVSAAGMQISPDRLEFTAEPQTSQQKELVVVNPTADVQLFEVFPDDNQTLFNIQPKSFTLEAGARKNVTVRIDTGALPVGVYSTNLSVISRPMADSQVRVNSGVKIPAAVTIAATNPSGRSNAAGILASAVVAAVLALLLWDSKRVTAWRISMTNRLKKEGVTALEPEFADHGVIPIPSQQDADHQENPVAPQ